MANITNENFRKNLRALMEKFGATQEMISRDLGIAQSAVSNYLNGRVPRTDILLEFANYFGVTADDLLGATAQAVTQKSLGMFGAEVEMLLRDIKKDVADAEAAIKESEAALQQARGRLGIAKIALLRLESIRSKANPNRSGGTTPTFGLLD